MLPLPAQHNAPATTQEQFATATRNRALFLLAEDMRAARRDDRLVRPGAVVLDDLIAALERCVAGLTRADTFAPDTKADELTLRRVRRWRLASPAPAWRTGDL